MAALLALLAFLAWRYQSWFSISSRFQDLAVYRAGALAAWGGDSPYADRVAGHGELVFTYPPFAAFVLVPFALLPWPVANALLLGLSGAAFVAIVVSVGRTLHWSPFAVLTAAVCGLLAEPVLRTLQQGQINLLIVAMVLCDFLLVPPRFRGVMTGIAAGIKIVPGIFVLAFGATREIKAALRCVLTWLTTVAVSSLLAPEPSREYWLSYALDTSRSGGGGYPDNQSLLGVVARLLQDDHPPLWVTLPLQVAVLSFTAWAAVTAGRRQDRLGVLLVVATGSLLASPVSWSHHWVWCLPMAMYLVAGKHYVSAAVLALVFSVSPLTLSPLGWLDDLPRPVWVAATALMPAFGVWFLLSTALRNDRVSTRPGIDGDKGAAGATRAGPG